MYDSYMFNGKFCRVGSRSIQKSIRIDQEAFNIIESLSGRSFSDKVTYLAYFYKYGNSSVKSNTKKGAKKSTL